MQLTYRGSVNRWECDENDHLNVRFYVEKHWQTLCGWCSDKSSSQPITSGALLNAVQVQHLRFLKESRLAAPLSGFAGIVDVADNRLQILTELRHSFTDEVLCTCVHELVGLSIDDLHEQITALPSHAAPRGIASTDLEYTELDMDGAARQGFRPIGMGTVQANECEAEGKLQIHQYMARISDAMPHLWGTLFMADAAQTLPGTGEDQGGAIVEYRLRYHQALTRYNSFAVMSGIAEVGATVQRFAHLVFDRSNGQVCVSAQSIGVRMDLQTRRAVELDPRQRAHLGEHLIKPLAQ